MASEDEARGNNPAIGIIGNFFMEHPSLTNILEQDADLSLS
jgi:hypothetical protein